MKPSDPPSSSTNPLVALPIILGIVLLVIMIANRQRTGNAPEPQQSKPPSTTTAPPAPKPEPVEDKVDLYDYTQDGALSANIERATNIQQQQSLSKDDIDLLCSGSESLRSQVEHIRLEAATKATSADLQTEYFNSRLEQAHIDWVRASQQAIKYFRFQRDSLRASQNQKWLKLSLSWTEYDVPHEMATATTTSGKQFKFPMSLSAYDSLRGLVRERWSRSMYERIQQEAFIDAFARTEQTLGHAPIDKSVVTESADYKDEVSDLYASYERQVNWQVQFNNNVAFAGHLDSSGKVLEGVVLYDRRDNHIYCKYKGAGIPVSLVE